MANVVLSFIQCSVTVLTSNLVFRVFRSRGSDCTILKMRNYRRN